MRVQFDDLFVISDLHMGGAGGFQIMNRGGRLGRFIQQLAAEPEVSSARRVGLVINGDAFDTLAEDFDGYIAVGESERILTRLYDDAAFAPVWSALAAFVRQKHRHLVFTIGNHDIELALPGAQQSIRRRLAGEDDAAMGRITFAADGAGYRCSVGRVRVFCTHGNEVDGWNVVDHDALRRLARAQNAGLSFDASAWTPNAGTRLVRDVMNRVKRQRPWVDLLKPERKVVLGALLTIDPGLVRHVPAVLPIARNRVVGELRKHGILGATPGASDDVMATAEPVALSDVVGPELERAIAGTTPSPAILRPTLASGSGATLLGTSQLPAGTLGWPRLVFDRLQAADTVEALRHALLDWHTNDRTFDLDHEDETCRDVLRQVGPDVDVVVTGHTHLERAIVSPARAYYNTGTWTRLIRFRDFLLRDAVQFRQLYKLLDGATLGDLDAASIGAPDGSPVPLVADVTTALRVSARDGGVVAHLGHVVDDGNRARFAEIERSEFRRA